MTDDRNVVAEDGYQERDDCAEAVAAARAEVSEAHRELRENNGAYPRLLREQGDELDALRARIEALADKWEGDRLNRVIDKEGAAYLLRAALAGDDQ